MPDSALLSVGLTLFWGETDTLANRTGAYLPSYPHSASVLLAGAATNIKNTDDLFQDLCSRYRTVKSFGARGQLRGSLSTK
jgi:hypothetical protein